MLTRREFIKSAGALAGMLALPATAPAAELRSMTLRAGRVEHAVRAGGGTTGFWAFNDSLPGPQLRFRKGDSVRIALENALEVDTAVHWHGVRVPNAMDGVPHVTQQPVAPGERFEYEFSLPDSGTFWYHPHQSSFEQVPRGLYGALIVEEERPIEVDRELVWVLSDVKLDGEGRQVEDYGRILDFANAGRLGNQVLLNGKAVAGAEAIDVRRGERVRLRLLNAASARIFQLAIAGHAMNVIAYDGQGVEPHVVDNVLLGPGMRVDLVIDFLQPAGSFEVADAHRHSLGPIARFAYLEGNSLRDKPMQAPIRLAPNGLPEPDLASASEHFIMFQGGMRGAPVIGLVDGKPAKIHDLMESSGLAWTMNYSARHEHALMHEPFLHLRLGEHVRLRMINETDYTHPMHLHGHFFRAVAVDGRELPRQPWRDTVLMGPRQTVDIAFVADNPGDWMYHCHILDHAAGGMMGTIRVG
jgi:FtsP/CotA-like multicopper oxidase with cupredoxin domain